MPQEPSYENVSTRLRGLSRVCTQLEDDILKMLDAPADTDLCVKLVQGILEAKSLSLQLRSHYIPVLRQDDSSLADVVQIAHDEIIEKVLAVESDLNRTVNRQPPAPAPVAQVFRLRSA